MTISSLTQGVELAARLAPTLPATFLNSYEILNTTSLSWPVNVYKVELADSRSKGHEQRGLIKNVIWELRSQHKAQCRGYGFVVDISPNQVAVPATWKLPVPTTNEKYSICLDGDSLTARATDRKARGIVEGILRESIKVHFKQNTSTDLGDLWQDYNSFCQYPTTSNNDCIMCRRFGFTVKVLAGGLWVVRLTVSTATIDGRTFADYYGRGEAPLLAERLKAKRCNRITRQNRPSAIRVLQQYKDGSSKVRALDFEDFDLVLHHATISREQQPSLRVRSLRCKDFNKPPIDVPLDEIRLILDPQITQEEHSETLIEPPERQELTRRLRSFIDGATAYGQTLLLSKEPVDAESFETLLIRPPAVRVRSARGKETIVEAPKIVSESTLKTRARDRSEHVRKYGFLTRRPINPLLACPTTLWERAGIRLKADLEAIWETQGVREKFQLVHYGQVDDIRKAVATGGNDALFVVLPERSDGLMHRDDTHENIKRRIEVPSQCIHYNNTLPKQWVDRSFGALEQAQPSLARRIRYRYELCLGSLLVKHNWFPFAPATSFHYNVHVGLDVGGIHDTHAMACLGYGFARPSGTLIFRPEEIPIEVQKKEPIPTDALYSGLFGLFEFVRSEIESNGSQPDFETVVFYRDGKLLGEGDIWNETQALERLHCEFLDRGWVTKSSIWTAVEIMKDAEGWRIYRNAGEVTNPVVGRCVFPFEDEQTALVCTTGSPYLTQGTACPLMIHIIDIHGRAARDKVIQDLVWQSDMCFTKPDIGMSLPWVLHVADAGALQLSRSYHITGITA